MVDLDNQEIYRQTDKADMRAHLYGLPRQCLDAWQQAAAFELPENYRDIDKVVILGMGGSAIGGDLVRSLAATEARPLIFVNRDYDLPLFVDSNTLVIASSYSGNTEEILSAFGQALNSGCKKLAMTTGGELCALAARAEIPVFRIKYVSAPRAALGYGFLPIVAFLRKLGFLRGIPVNSEAMAEQLTTELKVLKETISTTANPAKQIAGRLHGNLAVIYGAGFLAEVARRWQTQINENSKAWAFYQSFPELNHNAVVGYKFPPELASRIHVICLRSNLLHPRLLVRYQITGELLTQAGISHQFVETGGKDRLCQMMSAIYLGDWASYYMATLYQVDPTPVAAVDYLKKRLIETA